MELAELPDGPSPPQVSMSLSEFRRAVLVNLDRCGQAKDAGNAFYAACEWESAKEKYVEALGQVGGALCVPALARQPEFVDLLRRCHASHAACHLNLAACAARVGEHQAAAEHCREALRVEPKRAKSHFRLAQALLASGEEEEACRAADRAAALDCGRSPEVAALARKARAELAARRKRDAQRFSGLFSSERYAATAKAAAEEAARRDEADRGRVASAHIARHAVDEDERAALEAWVRLGSAAIAAAPAPDGEPQPPGPRAALMRLVRRAAREGSLEDGEARCTLREGGLAPALASGADPSAEGLDGEEAAEAAERARLTRARALVAQAAQGRALGEADAAFLAAFRREEMRTLRARRAEGLSQEDQAVLAQLERQEAEAAAEEERGGRTRAAAEAALGRLREGAHVGPRERFNTLRMLEEEQARLSGLEATRGLREDEEATLKAVRELFAQRNAKERLRAEQTALLKQMQSAAV